MFSAPDVEKPTPPPATPTYADASIRSAQDRERRRSLISRGTASASTAALTNTATTRKRSLLGGA